MFMLQTLNNDEEYGNTIFTVGLVERKMPKV